MNPYDAYSALSPQHSGDTRISTRVCAHCQRQVIEYRFTTRDAFSVVTYHCVEHGDAVSVQRHRRA
jgi:hypothetical protein